MTEIKIYKIVEPDPSRPVMIGVGTKDWNEDLVGKLKVVDNGPNDYEPFSGAKHVILTGVNPGGLIYKLVHSPSDASEHSDGMIHEVKNAGVRYTKDKVIAIPYEQAINGVPPLDEDGLPEPAYFADDYYQMRSSYQWAYLPDSLAKKVDALKKKESKEKNLRPLLKTARSKGHTNEDKASSVLKKSARFPEDNVEQIMSYVAGSRKRKGKRKFLNAL